MTLQIDIVSDTVCPWCFVGKRRLERALAQHNTSTATIHWRPFQLHPHLPPEGMDRRALMKAKFGDPEKLKGMATVLNETGRQEGIDFKFDQIARTPNTLDSHRLIRWAGSAGVQDTVVEALFDAYFRDGQDISDHDVLVGIAARSGMDRELVARLLDDGADRDLVLREEAQARQMGIQGVPFFIINGRVAISGAQEPDAFIQAFGKAEATTTAASTLS